MTALTVRSLKGLTIAGWEGIERHEIGLPLPAILFTNKYYENAFR
jgi:hypothetical protein